MVGSVALGEPVPDFTLEDLEGNTHRMADQRGRIVVLDFWSAECPWSRKSDEALADEELSWERDQVVLWRIASNANENRGDLKQAAMERGVGPVLWDSDQVVADKYGALTTPQLFIVDGKGCLRFMGAPDNSSWREPEPTRSYLVETVNALKLDQDPEVSETPVRGCAIVRHGSV